MKKLLWWILSESCSILIKFHAYSLKKDLCTGAFLWVLPNILKHFLLQNFSAWQPLLNTLFCSLRRTQPQKMFPSTLVISICSNQTLWIAYEQLFVEVLDSQLWLTWFIVNRASDSVKLRFCKTSQISQKNIWNRIPFS